MDGKATISELATMDLYEVMDLNEAMDVWGDMNDLDCGLPFDPTAKGSDYC